MKCRMPRGTGSQEDTNQITKSRVKRHVFYIACALLTSSSLVHQTQLIIIYLDSLIGPVLGDQLVKEQKHWMYAWVLYTVKVYLNNPTHSPGIKFFSCLKTLKRTMRRIDKFKFDGFFPIYYLILLLEIFINFHSEELEVCFL